MTTVQGGSERILCVDDERDVRLVVARTLELAGFAVTSVESASEALARIRSEGLPDLAIVDLVMPEHDGFWLCRELQTFCDLPVVLLTSVSDEPTTVRAIEQVAEDYIVKPFRPSELVARVRRVLMRVPPATRGSGLWNEIDRRLEVDFPGRRLRLDGVESEITPTEARILYILWRNLGRTIETAALLRRVWPSEEVFEDTLRVHVHRLRKKLEADPEKPALLQTDRGRGYRLGAER